jgi:sensor histidine kinase regulating citrate/malate metabolism
MTMYYESMALVLVSIMTLCTVCIFIFNFISITLRSHNEEQLKKSLELQSESYLNELKIVNRAQNEIRYLKHDIVNHLNTIQALINQNNYSEIQKYIASITGTLKKTVKVSNTGIEELDSIINLKISKANESGIKVDANIRIEKVIKIEPQDYVSIIGNLFDNAIEAVARVDSDCKHIDFKIGLITSLLVIRIENPYRHKIVTRDNEFLSTKQNRKIHGFGLMHVCTLVDKYDGTINITYENNFVVEISMFNK